MNPIPRSATFWQDNPHFADDFTLGVMRTGAATPTIAFIALMAGPLAPVYASLEKLLPDLHRCKSGDFYLDPVTHEPRSDYLRMRTPYKIENGFAYYRVETTFHGLLVVDLMVPASTWGVLAVTFDAPLSKARAALKRKLGSEFRSVEDHDAGKAPLLIEDRTHKGRTVLVCTNPQ